MSLRKKDTESKHHVRTESQNRGVLAAAFVHSLADNAPAWAKKYVRMLAPVLEVAGKAIDVLGPLAVKAWGGAKLLYAKIEPYRPDLIMPMILGLVLMLFGGYLMMTIAVVEAYRSCGYQGTVDGFKAIYEDYVKVKAASAVDDQKDEDGDGIADVLQVSPQQLVVRKTKLFLKAADPVKLSNGLGGIYSGMVAVLAVLRLKFARTMALGIAIGDVLGKYTIKYAHAPIASALPKEYHKWIDISLGYICKTIGISIAWSIQRVLAAVHSGVRGAQLFCDAFAVYTAHLGYTALSKGYFDEAFAVVCAVGGIYCQLMNGFSMPWFLSIPLFPLLFVEWALGWVVASAAY